MSIHRPPITHTFHQKVFVSFYFFEERTLCRKMNCMYLNLCFFIKYHQFFPIRIEV